MKTTLFCLSLLFVGSHAMAQDFDGHILVDWLPVGVTEGVEPSGKPCEVQLVEFENGSAEAILNARDDIDDFVSFNDSLGSVLVDSKVETNSLYLAVRIDPDAQFEPVVYEHINITKSKDSTEVHVLRLDPQANWGYEEKTCTIPVSSGKSKLIITPEIQ